MLEIVDTKPRFHEEIHCSTFEFLWPFRVCDTNRSQTKRRCKNKLDPRNSEPNRLFPSRVKSKLCMDLSLSHEPLLLAACTKSLNANEESKDMEMDGFPNRMIYSEETKNDMQKILNLKPNLRNRCWAPRQHSSFFSILT